MISLVSRILITFISLSLLVSISTTSSLTVEKLDTFNLHIISDTNKQSVHITIQWDKITVYDKTMTIVQDLFAAHGSHKEDTSSSSTTTTFASFTYEDGTGSVLTFVPNNSNTKQVKGLFHIDRDDGKQLVEFEAVEDASQVGSFIVENLSVHSDAVATKHRLRQLQQTSGYISFTPGCYANDVTRHELLIGIAVDLGMSKKYEGNIATIKAMVEFIISSARPLFVSQLNINLVIGKIVIGTADGTGATTQVPLNMDYTNPSTCITYDEYLLSAFSGWNTLNNYNVAGNEMAYWHLFTACNMQGSEAGRANMAVVCAPKGNVGFSTIMSGWLVFAHEFGHAIGSGHSFEDGVSKTGGIMDYINPYYNGVIQIHPYKKTEICNFLQSSTVTNCKPNLFKEVAQNGQCGDLLLADTEECECLTQGSKSCGLCVNCKLQLNSKKKKPECSSADFVMRPYSATPTTAVPVTISSLSTSTCCTKDGEFAPPTTTCNRNDVCVRGICTRFCSIYALPACSMANNGCTQPCFMNGACVANLVTVNTQKNIHYIPDGVVCDTGKMCSSGQCVSSSAEVTSQPTSTPSTLSPTVAVTCTKKAVQGCSRLQGQECLDSVLGCQLCTNPASGLLQCMAATPNGCSDGFNFWSKFPECSRPPSTNSPTSSPTRTKFVCPSNKNIKQCKSYDGENGCNKDKDCTFCGTGKDGYCTSRLFDDSGKETSVSCNYTPSTLSDVC